jgi:hypothetical protein
MARIVYSAEINEIIGSIGGTCFQRNNSGTISRLKNINRGKPSLLRQGANIVLGNIVKSWSALTLTQQGVWNTWAGLHTKFNYYGVERTLTGFNWFLSININRHLTGQAILSAPPTYVTPGTVPDYTMEPTAVSIEIEWGVWATEADYYCFVFATPPILSQSVKNRAKIRLVGVYNPNGSHYIDLTSDWEDTFGITYPSSTVDGSFYILTSIAAIDKVTGISGQFNSTINVFQL